jgi:hypothetical protein
MRSLLLLCLSAYVMLLLARNKEDYEQDAFLPLFYHPALASVGHSQRRGWSLAGWLSRRKL